MLADEVLALAIVPSPVAPNRKPRPVGLDRALKPWRLMTDAEKEIREARQVRAINAAKLGTKL